MRIPIGVHYGNSVLCLRELVMIFLIPLLAFCTCAILHTIALRDFVKLDLLDYPERYGHKRKRVPYPTGILAVLTFVMIFSIIAPWTTQSAGILIGVFLLALVSFTDDRIGLNPNVRLILQILITFIIFATGSRIYTLTNPLLPDGIIKLDTVDVFLPQFSIFHFQFSIPIGPLPVLSGIFTIVWMMLCINALNWFDGIPGQVSVLSTIGFLVIGALSLSDRVSQPEVALLAFILAAIAAAGALFDIPPNKVLMGDTGAMFFGLMLGVLTIYSGGKVATAFLVLGVPLIDVFLVILRRVWKGKNPMKGNATDEHLHHRLLGKGWSERRIIVLTAGLGALFGVSALFLDTLEKVIAAGALFIVMTGLSVYSRVR